VKLPVPLVVQLTPVWCEALAPVIPTAPAFEQVVWLPPALATGAVTTVNVIDDTAEAQVPLPWAVKVSVTVPLVISVEPGV
jgi:hypothetical protein